jgi:probable phosphoglycerate mutase
MPSDHPAQLLVVRHGETTWNREGRIQGHRDSPLTARGLAQARAVAARVARERLDALYASDLGRARQTAEEVAATTALPIRLDAGLRERAFGILEGKSWDDIAREHPDDARLLLKDPEHQIPGGESLARFRDRVLEALRRVARDAGGGTVVVVTHGGVLGVLYREAMGIPLDAPRSYETLNAGVNHFRYVDDRLSIVRWGDADHLEIDEALDDEV